MSTRQQHRYENCQESACERPFCRIWREARAEGYEEGHADGYAEGFAAGAASGGE
jgi:flagellar biosynthesis/type III secretory pathway protein FliH